MKRKLFAWIIAAICVLGIGSLHGAAKNFEDLSLHLSTEESTLYVSKNASASMCELMSKQLMKTHYAEQPNELKQAISFVDETGELLFVTIIH